MLIYLLPTGAAAAPVASSWQAPEWEQDAREAGIEGLRTCPDCDARHDSEVCPICECRDYVEGWE